MFRSSADGISQAKGEVSAWHAVAAVLFLALACLAVLVVDSGSMETDVSWLLVATQRWLEGVVLYEGVTDVNPPWMYYLARFALAFGAFFGLAAKSALLLFLILSAMLSFVFCAVLLRYSGLASDKSGFFLCFVAMALWLLPLHILAQREHMLVIFMLPLAVWMSFVWARFDIEEGGDGWLTRFNLVGVACALFALLGLLLKPHFFFLPAMAIALRVLQYRRAPLSMVAVLFSPANIVLALGAVAFLGFVYWAHPIYIAQTVPFGLRAYGDISVGFESTARFILLPLTALVAISVGAVLYRRRTWSWSPGGALCCYIVGGCLVVFLQGKGFLYHFLPIQTFVPLAAAAFVVAGFGVTEAALRWSRLLCSATIVAIAVHVSLFQYRWDYPRLTDSWAREFVSTYSAQWNAQAGTQPIRLLIWSPSIEVGFPMAQDHGFRWVGRYAHHWLVPAAWNRLYGSERDDLSPTEIVELEAMLTHARRTAVEDFLDNPPDIVLVDVSDAKQFFRASGFEFIDFFSTEPDFAPAWENYHKIGSFVPKDDIHNRKFDLYKRKDVLNE